MSTDQSEISNGLPTGLAEGYKAFHYSRLRHERERYEQLAREGQAPETMIISCCDSRAAPETVFDAAPGDLFVLRNVANLVPPCQPDGEYHGTSAALEFAVEGLEVRHIVVMGHGRCGGIRAFLSQREGKGAGPLTSGDFVGKWISLLEPAAARVEMGAEMTPKQKQRALEEAAIANSLQNLLSFPCIRRRVGKGMLSLHGAWFDIASGELWELQGTDGKFRRAAV